MSVFAKDVLATVVSRIERLEEERSALGSDIKEIYKEATGNGFDAKIIRKIVARRKKDVAKMQEEDALMETYMNALGMLLDTPLGQAAVSRASKPEPAHV